MCLTLPLSELVASPELLPSAGEDVPLLVYTVVLVPAIRKIEGNCQKLKHVE